MTKQQKTTKDGASKFIAFGSKLGGVAGYIEHFYCRSADRWVTIPGASRHMNAADFFRLSATL